MISIYYDTEAIIRNPTQSSELMKLLHTMASNAHVPLEIVVFDFVEKEAIGKLQREAANVFRQIEKLLGNRVFSDCFQDVVGLFRKYMSRPATILKERLEELETQKSISRVPIFEVLSDAHYKKIFETALHKQAPFHERDDKGVKDALIWSAAVVRSVQVKSDVCVVVSKDTRNELIVNGSEPSTLLKEIGNLESCGMKVEQCADEVDVVQKICSSVEHHPSSQQFKKYADWYSETVKNTGMFMRDRLDLYNQLLMEFSIQNGRNEFSELRPRIYSLQFTDVTVEQVVSYTVGSIVCSTVRIRGHCDAEFLVVRDDDVADFYKGSSYDVSILFSLFEESEQIIAEQISDLRIHERVGQVTLERSQNMTRREYHAG